MQLDRVEWHLENWATWARSYHPRLGMPSRALGLATTGLSDFDDLCEAADSYAAQATDAAIDNLTPAQSAAVNRKWLDAVYRFPRDNFIDSYADAIKRLGPLLDRQGLV